MQFKNSNLDCLHFCVIDSSKIVESSYGFSVVDSNGLNFLFYNSPDAARWLLNNSVLSFKDEYLSDRSSWVVCVPYLYDNGMVMYQLFSIDRQYVFPHFCLICFFVPSFG